jgi:UDP-glucose:(heptosyl)LPS alpha-1,3-glucosyltransferase
MKILHVVRRYGPVGGMERYVWELTRELHILGYEVEVLCEVCLADKPHGIKVFELGAIAPRPRWLSLLRFGKRVARWLDEHPHTDFIIHSHERLSSHHITTFHGPPFATVLDRPWWRKVSLRVAMQLFLERRELACARRIVPNSQIISKQLTHYYPGFAGRLTEPIVPGVVSGAVRKFHIVSDNGGIAGFVGKEWQRKGLPLAVKIVAQLRRNRPELELWVVGPETAEIEHLFAGWQGGYRLLGWRAEAYYDQFDVLLHPARAEPYGMVISEAMAVCVPVVVSDRCGAAMQITQDAGAVVPLGAALDIWTEKVEKQLCRCTAPPQFVRGWDEVAREYEVIYREIIETEFK